MEIQVIGELLKQDVRTSVSFFPLLLGEFKVSVKG